MSLIALKVLLPPSEFKRFIDDIKDAIKTITSELKVLTIDEILSNMGFPANWTSIRSMKK